MKAKQSASESFRQLLNDNPWLGKDIFNHIVSSIIHPNRKFDHKKDLDISYLKRDIKIIVASFYQESEQ